MVDYLDELNERNTKKKITNLSEILSQALLFLFAGYETVSSVAAFLAYSLALNPDCQKKVCQEIDQIESDYVKYFERAFIKNN